MRVVAACVLVAVAVAFVDEPSRESLQAIDKAVEAAIEKGQLPGAVVLILHKDKVVHRKAYGHRAKRPEPTLMTEDTVFDLASLTKPIATALALMLLAEDGKLDVHDALAKHLPAFARKETEAITLEQLLLHTSGFIPDNPSDDYQHGRDEAWRRLEALKPIAAPGTKFQY